MVEKKIAAATKKKIKLLTKVQVTREIKKLIAADELTKGEKIEKLVLNSKFTRTVLMKQLNNEIKDYNAAQAAKQKKKEDKVKEKEEASKEVTFPRASKKISEKDLLKEFISEEEIENYKEDKINWVENPWYDYWDKIVGRTKNICNHGEEYLGEPPKMPFLAHSRDKIVGKPQLIEDCMIKLPLVRLAITKQKNKLSEDGYIKIQNIYLIGENHDKRYNGYVQAVNALEFYKYLLKTSDDKEYYILSETKLPEQNCDFQGMIRELDDFSELNRTLKIPKISKLFFCKKAVPNVKLISKEELVKFTKEKKITEFEWMFYLTKHPSGTFNNFPEEIERLRSSFILQGKRDGYPFHWGYMGPQGGRKTMGIIEPLDWRINEKTSIAASTMFRLKGMIPSYKGSIPDLGFLCQAERMAFVDELGKMIEAESQKHDGNRNILGDFNDILEHKDRIGGSGNTNNVKIKASAKDLFVLNPCSGKSTIGDHVGLIDATAMGRILWWIQDKEEQEFVLGENGILRSPHKTSQEQKRNPPITHTSIPIKINEKIKIESWKDIIEKRKRIIVLCESWGDIMNRDEFLTIFDSCYNFTCELDEKKIQDFSKMTSNLAKEPMRAVWKPRAEHHIFLLIDGICKHRCLFKDYDSTFTPKQEDYDWAERILIRMIKGWDTDLSPRRGVFD